MVVDYVRLKGHYGGECCGVVWSMVVDMLFVVLLPRWGKLKCRTTSLREGSSRIHITQVSYKASWRVEAYWRPEIPGYLADVALYILDTGYVLRSRGGMLAQGAGTLPRVLGLKCSEPGVEGYPALSDRDVRWRS